MLNFIQTDYKETTMIGNVFRQGGLNILYGESGLGKTVSSIKALNLDGITPILLNFNSNDSPEQNDCEYTHVDGKGPVLLPNWMRE